MGISRCVQDDKAPIIWFVSQKTGVCLVHPNFPSGLNHSVVIYAVHGLNWDYIRKYSVELALDTILICAGGLGNPRVQIIYLDLLH